jgi:hypothetical protein
MLAVFYTGVYMPIIQDAISSLMGGDASDDWQSKLQPSSFRGVPFAVMLRKEVTVAARLCTNTLIATLPG